MPDDAFLTRSVPPRSLRGGPSARRKGTRLLIGAVLALLLVSAACSDDSEGEDEADRSTTESTAGSTDSTTTTLDNSQGKPLNENEALIAALAEPSEIAEGLEVSPESVGDGSFVPGLCPDQEVEVTWEDQASQGLLRTGEGGTLIFKQSVMAFPDSDAADAFIDGFLEAVPACNPAVQVEEVPDIGERTARFSAAEEGAPATAAGALVRDGVHVIYVEATGDPAADIAGVVSNDLLTRMVGLLPS